MHGNVPTLSVRYISVTNNSIRTTQLLNNWWDFISVPHPDIREPLVPEAVPLDGWQEGAYLVPGFFTDHSYPDEWRESRSGWARTRFHRPENCANHRAMLKLDGVIPKAHVFINGTKAYEQEDMFLGDQVDITDLIGPGENELAVFITEFKTFDHPERNLPILIDVPWGCCPAKDQAGIWQDVSVEYRPAVCVEDVTIITSVRDNAITIVSRLHNYSDTPFQGLLEHKVLSAGQTVFGLPEETLEIGAGESLEVISTAKWADYHPWTQEDPHLYHLSTRLGTHDTRTNGTATAQGQLPVLTDEILTRFGFREVWIEGHRIMLNGRAMRWSGEWCHKSHSHWLRPEYVRQWYQQIKDLNMNYVRMHTFPHPEYFLDIADEMGICVCQESALHGSGQAGWDTPELWDRARRHIKRMVRRDKNHPSLVLWSVENEMRWSLNIVPSAKDELPKLKELMGELDPTRPAYHDGDSSLWDETTQYIISRHYGTACTGLGWWDKTRPLHSGEVGRWHFASPYTALQWADDEVFSYYSAISRSIAMDACRTSELARANEVSCLFLWNTSGLDNFRPSEAKTFFWDEPNSPFLKPLAHKPYESEYAWWEDGKGYRPGHSFELIRHTFRPLALVIKQERTQFYSDRTVPHTVYLVNDLPVDTAGQITVSAVQNGCELWSETREVSAASGCTATADFAVPLDSVDCSIPAQIHTVVSSSGGSDAVVRTIRITDSAQRTKPLDIPTPALYGTGAVCGFLDSHCVEYVQTHDPATLDPKKTPVLIVADNSVKPSSDDNVRIRKFLQRGGSVLVLEQTNPLFPELKIARMPVEMAHARSPRHRILEGVKPDELRFFGDDPFGLPSSDSYVTMFPYEKPEDWSVVRPIIDSSGGDFAVGGLGWAPLIETRIGNGCLLASQLRLSDRWSELPVADKLLTNSLSYLSGFAPAKHISAAADAATSDLIAQAGYAQAGVGDLHENLKDENVLLVSGDSLPACNSSCMRRYLANGGLALVWDMTSNTRGYWEEVLETGIELFEPEHTVYQLVRATDHALLSGISNEDTCWLDNWTYKPRSAKDQIVKTLLNINGGTALLTNSTKSGLDVLFGDENATERKRMPTLWAYFDGPEPKLGGGLVEVPVGKGRVIFCQILKRPDLFRFRRVFGAVLANVGLDTYADVLAGDSTPAGAKASDGYPESVLLAEISSDSDLQDILSKSHHHVESYAANTAFREWSGWKAADSPEGTLTCPDHVAGKRLLIGLQVATPEPRKFLETVGGLPNPDLQTFLEVQGTASIRAWVNAVEWGRMRCDPDKPAVVSDIDLEAGTNFVLLLWEDPAAGAELKLAFQNRNREPEVTFAFS